MSQIAVNLERLYLLLSKLESFNDELKIGINDIKRDVEISEIEGWKDKTYVEFKEAFSSTESLASNMDKSIDDHIVYLKKIIKLLEDY